MNNTFSRRKLFKKIVSYLSITPLLLSLSFASYSNYGTNIKKDTPTLWEIYKEQKRKEAPKNLKGYEFKCYEVFTKKLFKEPQNHYRIIKEREEVELKFDNKNLKCKWETKNYWDYMKRVIRTQEILLEISKIWENYDKWGE